ncbi:MAG: prolyl oligopeptidase family serine peptidase [Myxococcota bacterium]|nr:prolyl oligopeptidase family serine peptidase [Myxococcota bacterium]
MCKLQYVYDFNADDLIALPRVDTVTPALDGSYAVAAVRRLDRNSGKYISDLWRIEFDASVESHQLTRGEAQDTSPQFTSDGRVFFLSTRPIDSDPSDTERPQVFCLPTLGGEPYPITDIPLGVETFVCAASADTIVCKTQWWPEVPEEQQRKYDDSHVKSGSSLLHYRTHRVRHWDHYRPSTRTVLIALSLSTGAMVRLEPRPDNWYSESSFHVSPNGTHIAVSAVRSGTDRYYESTLELLSVPDQMRWTFPWEKHTTFDNPRFGPDGQRIYCEQGLRSSTGISKPTIVSYAIDGTSKQTHTEQFDRWASLVDFDLAGDELWFASDDLGSRRLFSVSRHGGPITHLIDSTCIGHYSEMKRIPGSNKVLGIYSNFTQPPEIFIQTPGQPPQTITKLTGFDPDAVDCTVSELWTQADGGPMVQSWVLSPTYAKDAAHSVPGLVWIHGGPMSQWTNAWHWRWNAYVAVAAGYAVLAPNPTGSTGFGQALINPIGGNTWGDQCYRDILAAVDQFALQPGVDSSRLCAMGASFGGYMTNWIGANTNRFRALVTHAGLFDLCAFQGVTDYPSYWNMHMGGINPYVEQDSVNRFSPRQYIKQWKTPTLVIHGDKDYRVPVGEALALFEALQFHEIPSELAIFPDENHWILRPPNAVAWYNLVFDFIARWTR